MDAHIAELVGSDGATMYSQGGGGGMAVSAQGPSFSLGSFNANSNPAGWGLIGAIVILLVVYAKTRSQQK